MAIKFQKSGMSDLTLEKGRLFPVSAPIEINQELHLTESNNPVVIVYGDNLNLIELKFKGLTKDNYDGTVNGLKTWFEDSNINWMENNFTLIDEKGVSHTVRLYQKKFDMKMDSNGRYSVSLKFIEE